MRDIVDVHSHPEPEAGETTVVFSDHGFAAGRLLAVKVMSAPHRHTQFEVNHLLRGAMTYSYEGREIRLDAGTTAIFFGMVPHRVIHCDPDTRFVCLYVPGAALISLRIGEGLRQALFRGSFVEASRGLETDAGSFRRWHADLVSADQHLIAIARDEFGARLRRLEHDGWSDRRDGAAIGKAASAHGPCRSDKVEAMTRFIGERSAEPLRVEAIARAAGLHPNYAMGLFKSVVGMTITDYVTRSRLDTAQALLVSSDTDITAIAFASGFGSLSRFYEAFGARFGESPKAFRRKFEH